MAMTFQWLPLVYEAVQTFPFRQLASPWPKKDPLSQAEQALFSTAVADMRHCWGPPATGCNVQSKLA